ncbi:hypothetical protein [Noviluteimonas dokdonensis]|uniref:hypothetical protein n=1 Tax=Noviluteimonas dokdonensis TaxID=414050 RepID=UPI00126A05E0|nr:hypothetical protein [Lysobacter dokdonensis]
MIELIKFLQGEWGTLITAPFTFALFFVIAVAVAYATARWAFRSVIDQLRAQIDTLEKQLDDFRERLGLLPAHGNEYVKLSHADLKDSTLKLVDSVRALVTQADQAGREELESWFDQIKERDEQKQQEIFEKRVREVTAAHEAAIAEYTRKFKVRAILMKDALRDRIPSPGGGIDFKYENPNSTMLLTHIADDLERLARQLRP